ncbi:hypothetical protein C8J57DRAFT_1495339 [Mycena rebaudengoi]|nr:hypothetical protein C8J57DRAFT_1495339 [Mycena rebaudengoi]
MWSVRVSSAPNVPISSIVAIRAPCCKLWYDCPECHAEAQTHALARTTEMAFMCKKCKKAFRKDMTVYEESDEYCPHCDNHYVIDAKTASGGCRCGRGGCADGRECRMLKDDRVKEVKNRSIFVKDSDDFADVLG